MNNTAHTHSIEDLRKLSRPAAIALATASIEKVLDAARPHPEVHTVLCSLLDDLWAWQVEDRTRDKKDMSRAEARALPSSKLYDTYEARLLSLAGQYRDQAGVYNLLGASIAALGFVVWLVDGLERAMNPGKPFVLGNDIMEVDWEVLASALSTAVMAADDGDAVFNWQEKVLARLLQDHPRTSETLTALQSVPRDDFTGDIALPDRATSDPGNTPGASSSTLDTKDLEERITEYAAIAFATANLERLLATSALPSDIRSLVRELVDDLWAWQHAARTQGQVDMSDEQAKQLPSFQFYSRIKKVRAVAGQHPSQVHALVSAIADSLVFIAWTMDSIERRMNPGKPFVIGDEADERQWEALASALKLSATASGSPSETMAWQSKLMDRLANDHPGDPDGGVRGEPLARDYFEQ